MRKAVKAKEEKNEKEICVKKLSKDEYIKNIIVEVRKMESAKFDMVVRNCSKTSWLRDKNKV